MINNERAAIAGQMNQLMSASRNQSGKIDPFVANGGGDTACFMGTKSSGGKSSSNKKQSGANSNQSTGAWGSMMSSLEGAASAYPGANISPMQLDPAKLSALLAQDMRLELLLKTLDTQEQALQAEIASVKKVISKNIEGSFKLRA